MKLVILDRDGTINHDSDDYIKSPEEWTPLPGALAAIARLNQAGWRVVIASNQSGIGRGLFDAASLNAMHTKMAKMLAAEGGRIDAIFFCPHTPEDACDCRKPRPGLFIDICDRYSAAPASVHAVGDSLRDAQAAFVAGCQPHLVRTGKSAPDRGPLDEAALPAGTRLHADLSAFAEHLLHPVAPAP
jgi:D-glycero-D-manno-heptose 1,7-bisphosphate phosphatase